MLNIQTVRSLQTCSMKMQNSSYAIYIYLNSRRVFFLSFLLVVSLVPSTVPQANSLNERLNAIVLFLFFSRCLNETFFPLLIIINFLPLSLSLFY